MFERFKAFLGHSRAGKWLFRAIRDFCPMGYLAKIGFVFIPANEARSAPIRVFP